MSLTAALLIGLSAILHASWNFVSKRRNPTLAFFFVASSTGALVTVPILLANRPMLINVPLPVWVLVIGTGMAQAVYMTGLAGAYRNGDISLAYPLIRALPVLFVAVVSLLLGRGDDIGSLSLVGIVLIAIGCVVLPLRRFQALRLSDYRGIVYLMVLIGAVGTTAYTLIDDAALGRLERGFLDTAGQARITLFYISLQVMSTALMIGLVTALSAKQRLQLRTILADRALLLVAMTTGVFIMATYGLVLAAMAYVRDVSYVAAFRQLSIPMGALAGIVVAGEAPHRPKLAGVATITTGLALVGIG